MKIYWWNLFQSILAILVIAIVIYPTPKDLGVLYRKTHLIDQSLEELEIAYKNNPDSRITIENLAAIYGMKGEYHKQIDLLNHLVQLYPEKKIYAKNLSTIYLWEGNYSKYTLLLEERYKRYPDSKEAFELLRQAYIVTSKYKKLARLLEGYKQKNPITFKYQEDLFYAWSVTKNYDSLLVAYQSKIQQNPTVFEFSQSLMQILIHLKRQKEADAIMTAFLIANPTERGWRHATKFWDWTNRPQKVRYGIKERIKRFPGNDSLILRLARIDRDNADYIQARDEYLSYLEHAPNDQKAKLELADIYSVMGKNKEELAIYYSLLEQKPNDLFYLQQIALREEWLQNLPQALNLHQKILNIHMQSKKQDLILDDYYKIETLQEWLEDYSSAISTLQKIDSLVPSPEIKEKLAHFLEGQSRYKEALVVRKKLKNSPSSTKNTLAKQLKLADLYSALKQDSIRVNILVQIVSQLNDSIQISALEEIAGWFSGKENGVKAIPYYEQLQRLEPHNSKWFRLSGELRMWNQQRMLALQDFKIAIQLGADIPKQLESLAKEFGWNNQPKLALKTFSLLFAKHPNKRTPNLFYIAEDYAQLKKNQLAKKLYRESLIYLSRLKKNQIQQEQYFLAAAALNEFHLIARELPNQKMSTSQLKKIFSPILEAFLNRKMYSEAIDFIQWYSSHKIALPETSITRLKNEALDLKSYGRWDLAEQLSYIAQQKVRL